MKRDNNYIKNIDSLIAAVTGFIVVCFFTKYSGVGISPDAVMYLSTARNLHDHGQLHFFNNTPIVDFPVFYPIFLGLIYLFTGVDPIVAGTFIDGILFGGIILMTGIIVQRFAPKSLVYKWLVLAAVLLSQALLQVYTYLWSETLFIFMVFFSFFAFSKYLYKKTIGSLIVAAVVAAIAAVTRYAGVTVIATGGAFVLFDLSQPFKKRWKPVIIYSVISCSLLVINLLYNHIATGNSTGPRERSVTSLADNFSYFGGVIINWLTIPPVSKSIAITVGAAILLVLLISGLRLLFNKTANKFLLITTAFAFIYAVFIILSSTFSRYEQINNRLLSPMYVPLIIALTWWMVSSVKNLATIPKWTFWLLIGGLTVWMEFRLYQIDYQRYDDQYDYGMPGYSDDSWKGSGTINYLKRHREFFNTNAPIYSDAYETVYFFTGVRTVKLLPHRYFDDDISKFYELKKFYLIWFTGLDNPELISIRDIVKQKKLKLLKQFNDGSIYQYDTGN